MISLFSTPHRHTMVVDAKAGYDTNPPLSMERILGTAMKHV
jgi:hypothetical protein